MTKRAASGPFGTFSYHVVTKRAAVTKRAGCASNLIRFVTLVTKHAVVTKLAATHPTYVASNKVKLSVGAWWYNVATQNMRLKPVLNWANVCSPNILRTVRRTVIRFLIELLIRRTWFGQSKLYFVLNWLVMRCKLRPELAADAQQTA